MARQSDPVGGVFSANNNRSLGDPGADESERMALGRRITARMGELGLTKAELARKVGVKRWATIHDWITGRQKPRATNLLRLAEALQMDPVALLDAMLPEPDHEQWRVFRERNATLSFDEVAEARMLARSRPWVTAEQLEAVLSMLRVGRAP